MLAITVSSFKRPCGTSVVQAGSNSIDASIKEDKSVRMFIAWLSRFWNIRPEERRAQDMYITLAHQSRNPFFFMQCEVPDTLDGRFEILVLHLFLASENSAELSQLLLEAFFTDMDRSLREMGVGDTGIGKRIQAMSEAAFGRLKSYKESWHNDVFLTESLQRNLYRGAPVSPDSLEKMKTYMRQWKS